MIYPQPYKTTNSKYWYFNVTENGKRRNLSTRCTLKREAREFIQEYMEKDSLGYSEKNFQEYSAPYFIWETCPKVSRRLDEGKSIGHKYVDQSRAQLNNYILKDPVFPYLRMSEIRRRDILDLRDRLKTPLAGKTNTLNKCISVVKAIIAEAFYREDIPTDPSSHIGNIKEERTEREVFPAPVLQELFQERPGIWRDNVTWDLFFVMANTGLRCGEIRALKWDMWDSEKKVLKIHRAWKGNTAETLGLPKWNKTRDIPVSQKVADIIDGQPTKNYEDFIFGYADGSRFGHTWLQGRFRSVIDSTALENKKKLSPHCFRHTVNTYLLSKGVNPVFVQAFLGWSKNSTITSVQAGYTHFAPEHLRDVPAAMDELWKA